MNQKISKSKAEYLVNVVANVKKHECRKCKLIKIEQLS